MSALPTPDQLTARATRPGQHAPPLRVEVVGRELWNLADRRSERFTMIVFYRGLHCPVCRAYLTELDRRLNEFSTRGIEVLAVSGDDVARATRAVNEWKLSELAVGYGQSVANMREWGLFISHGIKDSEPAQFGEPGLFLVRPDGTLYYAAINSMPFGRPRLEDMLSAIDSIVARDYPARGEA